MSRFATDLPAGYEGAVMIIRTRTIHVDKEATAPSVGEGILKMRTFLPLGFPTPKDEFHYRLIVADDWQYYYDTAKSNLKNWFNGFYSIAPEFEGRGEWNVPTDAWNLNYLPAKYELKEF